jgi:hypothetical protein
MKVLILEQSCEFISVDINEVVLGDVGGIFVQDASISDYLLVFGTGGVLKLGVDVELPVLVDCTNTCYGWLISTVYTPREMLHVKIHIRLRVRL